MKGYKVSDTSTWESQCGPIIRKQIIQVVRIELLVGVVLCMVSYNVCFVELLPINTIHIEIIYVVIVGRFRHAVEAMEFVFDHTKEKEVTQAAVSHILIHGNKKEVVKKPDVRLKIWSEAATVLQTEEEVAPFAAKAPGHITPETLNAMLQKTPSAEGYETLNMDLDGTIFNTIPLFHPLGDPDVLSTMVSANLVRYAVSENIFEEERQNGSCLIIVLA
ncbi:hypothetical protein B0H14DRAFT_3512521 [Mycena olivaceomarginata]|nr:hypothetical protein B0H14DRAFT_3512521 [Mycena olivaceomarginata]